MVLDAFNKSGLTQKELADRLGWDEGRVSRCLGASSNWTLKTISALLAAIGVDLDDPGYTSFQELERQLTQSPTSTVVAPAADSRFDFPKDWKPQSVSDMTGGEHPQTHRPIPGYNVAKQRPRTSAIERFLNAGEDNQDEAA